MSRDPELVSSAELDRLLRKLAEAPEPRDGIASPFEVGSSRFHPIRRVGAGGFGVVWLVRDVVAGADVALKTLPTGRPELIYRLKREFRSLADLRHPNLVSFYELFAGEDHCFFTMEYVPGTTFLEHVRPAGILDPDRLRAAVRQLVAGLGRLHEAGMLHRDVKPANVLVTPEGRVVLLDFGLAAEIEESGLGRSAELAGTPEYMSPEHAAGWPLGPASDWYAVGVVLFQAIAGRLPFEGSWAELLARRRTPPAIEPDGAAPRELAELCSALLRPEPSERPIAEEIARKLGLGGAALPAVQPRDDEAPLVGRETELVALRDALRAVEAGRGTTVLVEGPSGIGKTSLVHQFLADAARSENALVLRGRCFEQERVPYQGIDSLVDDLCRFLRALPPARAQQLLPRHVRALVRLFPVLERVSAVAELSARGRPASPDEQESRRQAFGAFGELLARIADRHLLLVHIDDVQWGDLDTAALLRGVLRGPDAPSMLLVLAYRSEDRDSSPCIRALRAGIDREVRVRVDNLAPAAAIALAERLLPPDLPADDVRRLAGESGGNPFFVHELAREARRRGAHAARSMDLMLALRERIGRLPAEALRLLEVVAIAGQPIREDEARRAAGLGGAAWEAWRSLASERLVRFSGPNGARRVEALHDRIREAVTASIDERRATECHGRLAEVLEDSAGVDPEVLAAHHEAVGHLARARDLARTAATRAERALAFDRAARLLGWALRLAPGDAPERAEILSSLGADLANAGRGVEAARAFLDAAELSGTVARAELRRRAAEQLVFAGRVDEGRALAIEGLRDAGFVPPRTPRRALASLLVRRCLLRVRGLSFRERSEAEVPPARLAMLDHLFAINRGLSMADVIRGADLAARYLLLAIATGEQRRFARGLVLEASHAASVAPGSHRVERLLDRLDALDRRFGDPDLHAHVLLVRGIAAYCAGNWKSSFEYCEASERIFRESCTGVVWEIWTMRCFANFALSYLGRWAELSRRVAAHVVEARERGSAYGLVSTGLPFGMTSWLARGEVAAARSLSAEAGAAWCVRGFHLQHLWLLEAGVCLDLYEGRTAVAWRAIQDAWGQLERSMLLRIPVVRAQILHLRAGCALEAALRERTPDARRAALRDAAGAVRRLGRVTAPLAAGLSDLIRAALAAQRGDCEAAARLAARAAEDLDRRQMAGYAAAARRRLASLRGHAPPEPFVTGEPVVDPDAMTRLLAPGFP